MSMQLIHNMDYITDIFNHLGRHGSIPICLKSESGINVLSSLSITFKNGNNIELTINSKGLNLQDDKYTCHILSELDAQDLFAFEVSILTKYDEICTIKMPNSISIYLSRKFSRFKSFDPSQESYIFIESTAQKFKILDISSMGLSFSSDKKDFNIGELIPNITIIIDNVLKITISAEIKYIKFSDKYVYGICFANISKEDQDSIILYIFERCYYNLQYVNNIDYCIESTSDFTNCIKNILAPNTCFGKNTVDLNPVSENTSGMFLAVMNKKDRYLSCIESAFRIYFNTFLWLSPLLIDTSCEISLSKINTSIGFVDAMLNSPYAKYCITYVPSRSEFAQFFSDTCLLLNNNNIFSTKNYYKFLVEKLDFKVENPNFICKKLSNSDKFLKYCTDNLTILETNCYYYAVDSINFAKSFNIASKEAFLMGREIWELQTASGSCVAFAVAETCASPAADMCRIYLLNNNVDIASLFESLLPSVTHFFGKFNKECFYIFAEEKKLSTTHLDQINNIVGIKYMDKMFCAMMDYKGLLALKNFMICAPARYVKYYPLTYPQKSIWNIEKVYPGINSTNLTVTVRIKESVNFNLLNQAINLIIQLNSGMRTRMIEKDSQIVQYTSPYRRKRIDFLDFSNQNIDELYKWDNYQNSKTFNTIDSDLFYFCILKISDTEGGFYLRMHHVICDVWAIFSLIISKILDYYVMLKNRKSIPLIQSPSYFEYSIAETEYLHSSAFLEDKKFFEDKFRTIPKFMFFKPNLLIKDLETLTSARATFIIPSELTSKIKDFCSGLRVSIFSLFLSAIAIYIYKITFKQDVVIGVPVRNRFKNEKEITGMCVNINPIRLMINPLLDIVALVKQISEQASTFLKHKRYPYELIQKSFRDTHKVNHTMFGISLSYQNAPIYKNENFPNVAVRWHSLGQHQTEPLNIHISDRDNEGTYIINLDYLVSLFSDFEINQIKYHLLSILENVTNNKFSTLSDLEILSDSEKSKLLYDFNDTTIKYPQNSTVHELFQKQVSKFADKIAVECNSHTLTYSQLSKKSNQIAKILRKQGVILNSIVGILIDRSLDMIIAILGVLKSGGAYLPIDPQHPDNRINYILQDSKANTLITQKQYLHKVDMIDNVINMDDIIWYNSNDSDIENINSSKDLAYLIYTSGSTGNPKGVMLEHRSVVNFIYGTANAIDFSTNDVILSTTTISFDIFVLETLLPLSIGAKVVIADQTQQNSSSMLSDIITKAKITMLQLTPSRAELLLNDNNCLTDFTNVKTIVLGGEPLPLKLFKNFKSICSSRIFNAYGPTETTVWSAIKELSDPNIDKITIGCPIANTRIYIVDNNLNIVPIGSPGELCIAGDGLARGYWNNTSLTDSKFVFSPFLPNEKMYRTGDLAKWLPDGSIMFIGRIDRQVKLRGFRVELGEIESLLLKNPFIKDVVVEPVGDDKDKKICAYVVSDIKINEAELIDSLSKFLPEYMIPTYFIQINKIPLNPNGKIDKSKLMSLMCKQISITNYIEPSTPSEKKLADIWKSLLKLDKVGVSENFFFLGADSLTCISAISKIYSTFGIKMDFTDISKNPTISKLCQAIEHHKSYKLKHITKAPQKPYYCMSSAQKRIYLLEQTHALGTAYNFPFALTLSENIDKEKLQSLFVQLLERHEILRTSFKIIDNEPVQIIHDNINFGIQHLHIDGNSKVDKIMASLITPFDLKVAPLLRVYLLDVQDSMQILLIDMHHTIGDQRSVEILIDELGLLYNCKQLHKQFIQYKDFCEWQRNHLLKSKQIKKQEKYWLNKFQGEIPILNLPTDYPRPPVQSLRGNRVYFDLPSWIQTELKELCKNTATTLHTVMLTVFNILLLKYTSQNDLVVGVPVSKRNYLETENIPGMFLNTVALRSYIDLNETFYQTLQSVNKNMQLALENSCYEFEKLVEKLGISTDTSRNPLFDAMFVLHDLKVDGKNIGNIKIEQLTVPHNISKFDITLYAIQIGTKVQLMIEYCTDLFEHSTILRMSKHITKILETGIRAPHTKIQELDILLNDEKNQILNVFNDTDLNIPNMPIHQLFEEQAQKTPDNVAVICENKTITYAELNYRATHLAKILIDKNYNTDQPIAIIAERSIDWVVEILACLKSMHAFLVIDPNYPKKRIDFMLKDSNACCLLTSNHMCNLVYSEINILDTIVLSDYNFDTINNGNPHYTSTDLNKALYIIYTSGTTGIPKGVMVKHANIVNLVYFQYYNTNINFNKNVLQFASSSFDVCYQELFSTLLAGGKLFIIDEQTKKDVISLTNFIAENKIDVLFLPTSYLKLITSHSIYVDMIPTTVKHIITAGEQLVISNTFKKYLRDNNVWLHNHYGPCETHVVTTLTIYGDSNAYIPTKPTIGTPISNIKIYIVDKSNHSKLQSIGIPGELCIAGKGIASGYLNNPALNSTKLVSCPFLPGELMFKTGDIARWLPDGSICFEGRVDHQVKISGYRVELGEVEATLLQHPLIKEASVIYYQNEQKNNYLCAYIVTSKNISIRKLKSDLNEVLPTYMIPAHFYILDNIPLNINGKIDRSMLPKPDLGIYDSETPYSPPRNEIEKTLCNIWSTVLNITKVGIDHNFFETNGCSLLAMKAAALAYKQGIDVSAQHIYRYQTIRQIYSIIAADVDTLYTTPIPEDRLLQLENYIPKLIENNKCIDIPFQNVLLTGSTGYLGSHLLMEIISTTSANVYCLIREANPTQKLYNTLQFYFENSFSDLIGKRIFIIAGDVCLERFGLSQTQYAELGQKIDRVVNSSGLVKHMGNYKDFEYSNVHSVEIIADFCEIFNIPFDHMSTIGVAGKYNINNFEKKCLFTEKNIYVGQEYNQNEYIRSKFEAEYVILNRIKTTGLKAHIYRLGYITGRYIDGHFQKNIEYNSFYSVIKAILGLKMLPDSALKKDFEFSPVNICSKAIVKLMATTKSETLVYHVYNPNLLKISDFVSILSTLGIKISILENCSFNNYINEMFKHEYKHNFELISFIITNKHFFYNNNAALPVQVSCDITNTILEQEGIFWPYINKEYIERLITYTKKVGFIV